MSSGLTDVHIQQRFEEICDVSEWAQADISVSMGKVKKG